MLPNRWKQISTLLAAALDLPPEERDAFLTEACGDDQELRRELDSLLEAEGGAEAFFDEPFVELAPGGLPKPPGADPFETRLPGGPFRSPATRNDRNDRTPSSPSALAPPPTASAQPALDGGRFAPGTLLAERYRIVSTLGRGGMGEVYRADDLKLGLTVALKFLPPAVEREPEVLKQFHEEARLAREISHPNVCRVHDVGEADGLHFLSMEHIDGENLAALIERLGQLSTEKVAEIGRDLTHGLDAIHGEGILHRDLKPANVLLDGRGRARIADFGIALRRDATAEALTIGTPSYMAPELLRGKAEPSVQSDLYALGLVLYELATGKRPFTGTSVAELAEARSRAPETRPGDLVIGLDPAVEEALLACLDPDPASRPATARELLRAFTTSSNPDTAPRALLVAERVDLAALPDLEIEIASEIRDLLRRHGGRRIDEDDGILLLLFDRPSQAVQLAQDFHRSLDAVAQRSGVELAARIGIHLAEVPLPPEPIGEPLADAVPRLAVVATGSAGLLASVAVPGQTLLSRGAFDLARRGATRSTATLRWLAHGSFLLPGLEEPVEIFEVGREGLAPFTQPDLEQVTAGAAISGWRPATGLGIPQRPAWRLEHRLGTGGFGEAWVARYPKTGERRVFKFCHQPEHLQALRREITIFRLLKEELGERDDIARVLDWSFEEPPYFIELEYTSGGDLLEWADQHGGLDTVPLEERLQIVARVATALTAAHSVGVLHKDVKPSNILIGRGVDGRVRVRLTDFGIGAVVERERLERAGITADGLTQTAISSPGAGTRLYMAPEVLEGRPASVQSDVYSLGVLLYQVVVGDTSRALAPGWEDDIADELLRKDIAAAVDRRADQRLLADQLASRLRGLAVRRKVWTEGRLLQAAAAESRQARQRANRLRLMAAGGIGVLFLMLTTFYTVLTHSEQALYEASVAQALADLESVIAPAYVLSLERGIESATHNATKAAADSELRATLESWMTASEEIERARWQTALQGRTEELFGGTDINFYAWGVAAHDGTMLSFYPSVPGVEVVGKQMGHREWFHGVPSLQDVASPRATPGITDPLFSHVEERVIVAVGAPIRRMPGDPMSEIIGVFGAKIDLSRFDVWLAEVEKRTGRKAEAEDCPQPYAILLNRGHILRHPCVPPLDEPIPPKRFGVQPEGMGLLGGQLPESFRDPLREVDLAPALAVGLRIPGSHRLSLIVVRDQRVALAPAIKLGERMRRLRQGLVVVGLGALAVGLLLLGTAWREAHALRQLGALNPSNTRTEVRASQEAWRS